MSVPNELRERLADALDGLPPAAGHTAVIGFDAVADTVLRPVRAVTPEGEPVYFDTIGEYAAYLASKAGLSCAVDVRTLSRRPGGNMVNLAHALGTLGVDVTGVGTLGWPGVDEIYRGLAAKLFTLGPTGSCTALQFNDGKVMLSDMQEAQGLDYAAAEAALGGEALRALFGGCELAGFVNWAELGRATDLWRGVLERVWKPAGPDRSRFLLVDYTDCSRRPEADIRAAAALVAECAAYRQTVVSLNYGEALQFARLLGCGGSDDPCALAEALYGAMGVDAVYVHPTDCCAAASAAGVTRSPGLYVERPLISVGGGDNFNAGLAFALLNGFDQALAGFFANVTASHYVRAGHVNTLGALAGFLRES